MDHRTMLKEGTVLAFPGMECRIEKSIGRGSNAIVYEGSYPDALNTGRLHRVLVKELFPYDPEGHIWRDDSQRVCRDARGEALWELHRCSFERGNEIHLRLLAEQPDRIGGNVNTFFRNQTYYTILDYSGGRSLDRELAAGGTPRLRTSVTRLRKLLHVLETFHRLGFLHLDISTDNVLLVGEGEQERVLLIDYNSVHTLEELREGREVYFSAKDGFSAPEASIGLVQEIGQQTDLFSAAAVFYACLTGRPLTLAQLTRRRPPDLSDSPLLEPEPPTVKLQVKKILYRGLNTLAERRYASCGEMLADLEELENRIAGVGVTHAALWEVGRRNVQNLIRRNPALSYVQSEGELYPLRIQPEQGESMPAGQLLSALAQGEERAVLLLGEGGSGKSTVLLRAVCSAAARYTQAESAVVYVPLFGWKPGMRSFILDQILAELRFDRKTRTLEDARHALLELLGRPLLRQGKRRAVLLLLLDGLNEASGDPAELLEEITALSALEGLRMVITSRSAPEKPGLCRAAMIPLEERDVEQALAGHGLLMPEQGQMRHLLRTPMMLSLFIRAAENRAGQLFCQSEEELLACYLRSLCEKMGEQGSPAAYFQADAAVRLVLPAIAREIAGQGRPLEDADLLRSVSRCFRVFSSGGLVKAFPEWIGHSREILGEAARAEEWYGQMVQQLLWRRLGLLVRDEKGRYSLSHQMLQEYFLEQWKENSRRLRRRQRRLRAGGLALAVLLSGLSLAGYELFLKPKPYDEVMSEMVLSAAVVQYVNYGKQNESMRALLEDQTEPEECQREVTERGASASASSLLALESLKEGNGEVVPWSGEPIDLENASVLLEFPQERGEEYQRLIRAYELVEAQEASVSLTDFSDALLTLLDADADIAWLLNQLVFAPHFAAMEEERRVSFETGLLSLPAIQESRQVDTSQGLSYALSKAYERQRNAEMELGQMAVLYDPYVKEGGNL